ncbi:MAG: RNA polymerase sigma factor [Candidatus Giovannonibacteria bacterium GW2011_GWA2_53_7]|uniref:RNA polymerase sigma factor n=1 Tax=Candidatus Giovannonibacteria bacterium GW2011_GWA2_53_7 TaxID=1618650 RepID=A0A0G1Y0C1_9BACT|nr:MAG: RNA polymerase sigma factor [Candidatus Giovannonibacteria bacterium GW2011_GWA2_53_7]
MIPGKPTRSEQWKLELEREFLAAYDEHADALFRHCLLRVRDREAAKDVVQEAFSRTWLYLSEGKDIEYMRAFLYRVANNLIVDASRKKKSSSLDAMMENDGFEVADESLTHPDIIPQTREVVEHLKSLDDIYRVAITKRFFEEKSPKEIAVELGVSENVVSVRIHRGIERLGRLMKRKPLQAA